jgi:hypothetical protein
MARKLALALMALILILPATALAVWGGELDGNDHPSVGAMYFDADADGNVTVGNLICSGSYAGPSKDGLFDVFLTAGHCLPPPELGIPASLGKVSFDNNESDIFVDSPITVQEFHRMPGWGHDFGDLRDLGVLLLPAGSVAAAFPDAAANPVQLPTENYLDELKADHELQFRIVDLVGYGVIPDWSPGGPTTFAFDGARRAGTSIVIGLRAAWVLYNQQRHGIGTGSGLCFGDSGSPQFDEGTLLVLSVTTGGNGQCNANNENYRVDTALSRAFLGQFLDLP